MDQSEENQAIAKVSKFTGITEHVLSILSPSGARGEVLRGLLRMSEAEPVAWECTDERYRFNLGIVTTRPETVAAWREGNIKFAALIRSAAAPAAPIPRDHERFARLADEPLAVIPAGYSAALDTRTTAEIEFDRGAAPPPPDAAPAESSNDISDNGAPQPRGEPVQTNATQPTGSPNIAPPPPDAVRSALAERLSKLAVCLDYRTPHPHTRFVAGLAMSEAERDLIVSSLRSTPANRVPVPAPNADQVEYLRGCEHKPFDPTVVIGSAGGVTGTRDAMVYTSELCLNGKYKWCIVRVLLRVETVVQEFGFGPDAYKAAEAALVEYKSALSPSDAVAAAPVAWRWKVSPNQINWVYSNDPSPIPQFNVEPLYAVPPVRDRETFQNLADAIRFVLAFYEPGQKYLDTNAWKNAEAGARFALKEADAIMADLIDQDLLDQQAKYVRSLSSHKGTAK